MAGSVNKVILVGNLGADPEIRHTQDGRPIAHLRVATSERWRDRASGEMRERTEWHRVVIFSEGLVRVAEQYLRKGSKVYLEGQLQTRKWVGQDSVERYTTEVVLQGFNATLTMLDSRQGGGWQEQAPGMGAGAAGGAAAQGMMGEGYAAGGEMGGSGDGHGPGSAADAPRGEKPDMGAGTGDFVKELDDDVPF